MRLLVCGSRDWTDWSALDRAIMRLVGTVGASPSVVIHGAAPGADSLAGEWAQLHRVMEDDYPANWQRDGKSAGPKRNARMLAEGKPDRGLAFGPLWRLFVRFDPSSRCNYDDWKRTGTGDMVKRMLDAGIPVRWIEKPGAEAIDLTEMPGPPR